MLPIPDDISAAFTAVLAKRGVSSSRHADYRKWLRYFLDFRSKYPLPNSRSEQVRLFIQKLQEKKQSPEQQKQAAHALSLFFESQPRRLPESRKREIEIPKSSRIPSSPLPSSGSPVQEEKVATPAPNDVRSPAPTRPLEGTDTKKSGQRNGSRFNEWRCLEKSDSPAWDKIIDNLAAEIKTRHYSRKTLKTYADWCRKFQSYLRNKRPDDLSASDVKAYLTYLAVNCRVAASTQNQAFNALLFLYRHILKKDFGQHKDIPRAKKSSYIPIVLSRQEIDAVIKHLLPPYDLVVKLLYGCGLRLFEGVKLRVKDFNFDAGMLTVRGKGSKSRTVPMPRRIVPELRKQMELVGKVHDEDCETGFSGVFMEDQLDKKYPNAAKEFVWQWFFPQSSLTALEETKEKRRYQRALRSLRLELFKKNFH